MDPRALHGASRAVVLLHASTSSSRQWDALAEELRASGRRVVAVDVHGHGGAQAWSDPRRPLTLSAEAARVVDAIGPCASVDVVGHSYGGAVALKLATMRPELAASVTVYEPVLFQLLVAAGCREAADEVRATAAFVEETVTRGQPLLAARRFIEFWSGERAWAAMPETRRLSIAKRMAAVALQFDALFAEALDAAALSRLAQPMLFLAGSRTIAPTHELAAIYRSAAPAAQHRVLEGLGHMGPVTDPAAVNAVIRGFLDTTVEAGAFDVAAEVRYRAAA